MMTIKILSGNEDTLRIATHTAKIYGYFDVFENGYEFDINEHEKAENLCEAINECGVAAVAFENRSELRDKLIEKLLENIIDVESEKELLMVSSTYELIQMIQEQNRD